MDLRTSGPAWRLVQSYTGGLLGQQGDTTASTYDNAVVIDAYLARGDGRRVARARPSATRWSTCRPTIPPATAGCATGMRRLPWNNAHAIGVTDPASSTGTLAWAGQALVQLYAATRIRA